MRPTESFRPISTRQSREAPFRTLQAFERGGCHVSSVAMREISGYVSEEIGRAWKIVLLILKGSTLSPE
jgi:hypothetical protein